VIGLVSKLAERVVPPVLDVQSAVWVVTVVLPLAAAGTKATLASVPDMVTTTSVGAGGRGSVNAALGAEATPGRVPAVAVTVQV
jgi:hypothetical protein